MCHRDSYLFSHFMNINLYHFILNHALDLLIHCFYWLKASRNFIGFDGHLSVSKIMELCRKLCLVCCCISKCCLHQLTSYHLPFHSYGKKLITILYILLAELNAHTFCILGHHYIDMGL